MKTNLLTKGLFVAAMMLVTFVTNALAGAKIYFDGLAINAGETQTAALMLENDEDIVGVQYTVKLPAGLSITGKAVNSERIVGRSHTLNVNQLDAANNVWVITLSNTTGKVITGHSGAVATITFTADASFAGGNIVPIQDGVVLTTTAIDENGNAVQVDTEAPMVSINKLQASLEIAPAEIIVSAEDTDATIAVGISNNKPVQTMSLKVVLPTGMAAKMANGYVSFNYADRLPESFEISGNYKAAENVIIFAVTSSEGETIPAGNGELFYFDITSDVKALAENSVISFIEGKAGDENAVKTELRDVTINVTNAQVEINENVWAAVQADVEQVQMAIANFETIVATMQYASRYEGEEVTGPVDAAREWVATTLEAYQAKYEAKALTAEDGVKGDALEQVAAVYEALNLAAKYDVSRYVSAVVYAWAGDDDEIEGAKAGIMEIIATLPTAGQSALLEQIDMLEAAMGSLLEEYEAYVLYNEDAHAAIIKQSEDIMANITELVAAADEAAEAEKARVAANLAAAEADMEKLEGYQAEITAAIKDNEKFISADTRQQIETLLGDTYMILIQQAFDETAAGGEYESPINDEWWAQQIADIKAEIAANKAAEEARVAANLAAAEADVEKLEGYQTAITEAIKDNEQFISADTKQQINTLLGDTYMILIQQALDEVAEEGVYTSPINDAWWAQQIAAIKAEIAANKKAAEEAEAERVEANKKAYDADLSTLGRIQNKYNQTVTRILTLYAKYEDQEAELAVQNDIYALQDLCAAALEAVAKAGEYESPLTEEVLAKINAAIDKLLEDAKLRAESDGIIAVDGETDVTFYTLQGIKVQRPVRGQTYIVKSQTSAKKIVW